LLHERATCVPEKPRNPDGMFPRTIEKLGVACEPSLIAHGMSYVYQVDLLNPGIQGIDNLTGKSLN
jgi:hypothetical protein